MNEATECELGHLGIDLVPSPDHVICDVILPLSRLDVSGMANHAKEESEKVLFHVAGGLLREVAKNTLILLDQRWVGIPNCLKVPLNNLLLYIMRPALLDMTILPQLRGVCQNGIHCCYEGGHFKNLGKFAILYLCHFGFQFFFQYSISFSILCASAI